jgi:hypothetical protein
VPISPDLPFPQSSQCPNPDTEGFDHEEIDDGTLECIVQSFNTPGIVLSNIPGISPKYNMKLYLVAITVSLCVVFIIVGSGMMIANFAEKTACLAFSAHKIAGGGVLVAGTIALVLFVAYPVLIRKKLRQMSEQIRARDCEHENFYKCVVYDKQKNVIQGMSVFNPKILKSLWESFCKREQINAEKSEKIERRITHGKSEIEMTRLLPQIHAEVTEIPPTTSESTSKVSKKVRGDSCILGSGFDGEPLLPSL